MTNSSAKKVSVTNPPRIVELVGQLNDIARAQVEFMYFFPPIADEISVGLAGYLGEEGCSKLSNNQDDFAFDEDYGHDGLGVEGGRFRIPLMVRIRDHNSCKESDDVLESDGSEESTIDPKAVKKSKSKKKALKQKKKAKKGATLKAAETKPAKVKKSKKTKVDTKSKKRLKKAKKKASKNPVPSEKDHTATDCSETFLRFKLLFEHKQDKLIVDIAGTKKITIDSDNFEPLYEAIFVYLKGYFSVEKFFDKQSKSYQNASYGFFRKHF